MALQRDFIEAGKGKLTQAKAFLEELEVQMALGKAEARDAFEIERKNLTKYLNKQKVQLKDTENIAIESKKVLLQNLETLEIQLGKELPHAKQEFDQQKSETLETIYKLEAQFNESYGDVSHPMQNELDNFKIKLDSYRVQLALASIEEEEALAKRKNELQQNVDEIRVKLQEEANSTDRLDHFVDEVTESLSHMKKAFSDLFA